MTDISDAADLVETARAVLLRDLVPALPGERRYPALMVANAMAIAAREHRLGPGAARDEAARLAQLLAMIGRPPPRSERATECGDLPALRDAVRSAIRAGEFDAPERARALTTGLAHTAHDRVAISNPKALRPQPFVPADSPRHGESGVD
jgi:hypothetical protein